MKGKHKRKDQEVPLFVITSSPAQGSTALTLNNLRHMLSPEKCVASLQSVSSGLALKCISKGFSAKPGFPYGAEPPATSQIFTSIWKNWFCSVTASY